MAAILRAPSVESSREHIFSRDIDAVVEQGYHRWKAAEDRIILGVLLQAGIAPVGDDLIFDIMLDAFELVPGGSIYTTTANRPTVLDGQNEGVAPAPDVPLLLAGHYLTVDTVNIGTTTAGSKIDLQILYRKA